MCRPTPYLSERSCLFLSFLAPPAVIPLKNDQAMETNTGEGETKQVTAELWMVWWHTRKTCWKTQTALQVSVTAACQGRHGNGDRVGGRGRAEPFLLGVEACSGRQRYDDTDTNTHLSFYPCLHCALHTAWGHAVKPCVSVTTVCVHVWYVRQVKSAFCPLHTWLIPHVLCHDVCLVRPLATSRVAEQPMERSQQTNK